MVELHVLGTFIYVRSFYDNGSLHAGLRSIGPRHSTVTQARRTDGCYWREHKPTWAADVAEQIILLCQALRIVCPATYIPQRS